MAGGDKPDQIANSKTKDLSNNRAWKSSPVSAWAIRATAVLLPVFAAWFAVRQLTDYFFRPSGVAGLGVWAIQATVVGLFVSMIVQRATQRLVPLAALLNMSLVFPDQSPSRFGLALTAGSVRQQRKRLAEIESNGLGPDESIAAERAINLVTMLGQHDRLTRGHTERVRAYAELIAQEMNLPAEDRQKLAWGTMLHDVGKMAVASEILNKDGKPDKEEWAVLQRHPAAGAAILEPLAEWLGVWGLAAAQHHERWDGTGYPNGLAGTEVSLAGRITSVADAFDVMTSRRSYKAPMPAEDARRELVKCSGTQFDPNVVRAFLSVSLKKRWTVGPLAWLTELPSLAGSLTTVPASALTSLAAVGTVAVSSAILTAPVDTSEQAERLALVQEVPADESIPGTGPNVETTSTSIVEATIPPPTSSTDKQPTDSNSDSGSEVTTTLHPDETNDGQTTVAPEPDASFDDENAGNIPSSVPQSTPNPPTSGATTTSTAAATTSSTVTSTTTAAPTTTVIGPGGVSLTSDTFELKRDKDKKIHVLDNDSSGDSGFDLSTFEIIVEPEHANKFRVHNDHIHYKSEKHYVGSDYLSYRLCNDEGSCAVAGLSLTVTDS